MGAVATTFMAGVEQIRKGRSKPIGSLTQMGTIRLGKRTDGKTPLIQEFVPLAKLDDIVFGGWDLFPDDAYQAAKKAGVLSNEHLAELKDFLSTIKPMKAVFDQEFVKKLTATHAKTGKSKLDLADQVIEDIKSFKKTNNCDRLVMVWCGSTEVYRAPAPVHATIASFEKGLVAKLEGIVCSEFVRMDYSEAIQVLERAKEKFEFPVKWGVDLQSEHERYLTEKHAKKPVIVMNYPKAIKAFYMRVNDDGKTVAAMDVLAPGIGEIIGGSQREERLEVLDRRMDEIGIDKEHMGWYRDLRRYGTVPHAGFGLGFERTIAYVTGLNNVRDAIPFPRTPGNARY